MCVCLCVHMCVFFQKRRTVNEKVFALGVCVCVCVCVCLSESMCAPSKEMADTATPSAQGYSRTHPSSQAPPSDLPVKAPAQFCYVQHKGVCLCVCVCVCVRERERDRERECVRVCVSVHYV